MYSTVDRNALHVQLADEAVCVGEAASSKSYLNIPNILAAATSRGAEVIHLVMPTENDRFAEMCRDHGITLWPPTRSVRGRQSHREKHDATVGVPTVPGSEGCSPLRRMQPPWPKRWAIR